MEKKKTTKTKMKVEKKTVKKPTVKSKTKKNTKKKGFTLIELLAVIIILGILMIIAIPSVTKYINDSRKSAYVDTAKEIVSGTRNLVNEGKLGMYDTGTTYYIPAKYVSTENGLKSPYGEFTDVSAYVGVVYDGKGYKYYWISSDDTGQGIDEVTPVDELDVDDIKSDLKIEDILSTVKVTGIGNRDKIKVFDLNNNNWSDFQATDYVPENGGSSSSQSCTSNCTCVRATVLHTGTCSTSNSSQYGCYKDGKAGQTITFGNQNVTNGRLTTGDAFDCDVNGDGEYDASTERFYYVTKNGNDGILIYYNNTQNGVPNSRFLTKYEGDDNYSGPTIAATHLPTTSQWPNVSLRNTSRQITNELGTTTVLNNKELPIFDYSPYAARFLTIDEVARGCNIPIGNQVEGELSNCTFLFENTFYTNDPASTYGFFLENPVSDSNDNSWCVREENRMVISYYAWSSGYHGTRPAIEVPINKIQY